jgi:hypothetical protein
MILSLCWLYTSSFSLCASFRKRTADTDQTVPLCSRHESDVCPLCVNTRHERNKHKAKSYLYTFYTNISSGCYIHRVQLAGGTISEILKKIYGFADLLVKDSFKNQIRSNLAHVCTQKALHSCMYQPTTDFGNSKWEVSYFDVRCLFWQPLKRWSRQLHLQSIITNCRMAMLDDPFKCRLDNFTLNVQPYPMRQSKPVGVVITRHSAAQSRSPDPIDFHRFRIISCPGASCGWMSTVISLRTGLLVIRVR